MERRGKGFPRLSLAGAVQVIEAASKFGKTWKREQFAGFGTKSGAGSAKSGAFAARVSSLRDYGLIISDKESIVSTELAQKIAKPINSEEREEAIRQAFLNVSTFGEVYSKLNKNEALPKDQLAAYAVNELGVARESKDKFVSVFIDSGEYAGLVSDDKDGNSIILLPVPKASGGTESIDVQPGEIAASNEVGEVASFINNLTPRGVSAIKQGDFSNPVAMNEQGVNHSGDGWSLTVVVKSSHRLSADLRKSIRDLLEGADGVADAFYGIEEKESSHGGR